MLSAISAKVKRILVPIFCLCLLLIGFLIGYFIRDDIENERRSNGGCADKPEHNGEAARFAKHSKILEYMKAEQIQRHTKYFSSTAQITGSAYSKEQANYVERNWRLFGIDKVKIHKYDVLLSYPKENGKISLLFANGTRLNFDVKNSQEFLMANHTDVVSPYNAYSPPCNITSQIVYANYGLASDFNELKKQGINVTGKIVIIRHGFPYRGQQVDNAYLNGALAVLLYSDPQQFNPNGNDTQFPRGWELPDSVVPIGTIIERPGDPLTREFPSKQGFYKTDIRNAAPLPKIPSQPMPFDYAKILLREMDGIPAPKMFQGGGEFTYRLNSSLSINLQVQTELKIETLNVVSGLITGAIEPDRLIMIGNHRDSWQYGASDASGAQSTLMEIARSLGNARQSGWRPRRSIMMLSWDAHEQGMHGSHEWVEEFSSMLFEQAVAYLNVDVAVEGNYTIDLKATPELNHVFYDVIKGFEVPKSTGNLFEDWLMKRPSSRRGEPRSLVLITGSDYKPFYHTIGVSCVEFKYTYGTNANYTYPLSNPIVHTVVDNYQCLTSFIDPDFRYHLLIGKIWLKLALKLVDSTILPFNLTNAANHVHSHAISFKKIHEVYLQSRNLSCDMLVSAALGLRNAVIDFEKNISKVDINDELKVRMVNDRIQNFQRQFIHQSGTMGRDDLKNVLYSTRWDLINTRTRFTAISHAIFKAISGQNKDWDEVKKQLMIATHRLQAAAHSFLGF